MWEIILLKDNLPQNWRRNFFHVCRQFSLARDDCIPQNNRGLLTCKSNMRSAHPPTQPDTWHHGCCRPYPNAGIPDLSPQSQSTAPKFGGVSRQPYLRNRSIPLAARTHFTPGFQLNTERTEPWDGHGPWLKRTVQPEKG